MWIGEQWDGTLLGAGGSAWLGRGRQCWDGGGSWPGGV